MAGGDSTIIDRVNGVMTSVAVKAPVACATTANITLSGAQTIDTVAVTETSPPTRVLVKNQTDHTKNGIYDVFEGAWIRSVDFDGAYDAVQGTVILVYGGTQAALFYQLATANPVVFETSNIVFQVLLPRSASSNDINILDYGADPTGATDSTGPINNALAVNGSIYIPPGTFKFSIVTPVGSPVKISGAGPQSICVPLGTAQPCFICAGEIVGGRTVIRRLQILDITSTKPGIWTTGSGLYTEEVYFNSLKYGIITNASEWTRHDRDVFAGCGFAFYASCSYGVTTYDPIGFDAALHGGTGGINPSEHNFDECWIQGGNTGVGFYQDNGNNSFDNTSFVNFSRTKIVGNLSLGIVIKTSCPERGVSALSLKKCWFEGKDGTESSVTIQGVTYLQSIINTSGCSVLVDDTLGLGTDSANVNIGAVRMASGNQFKVTNSGITGNAFFLGSAIGIMEDCTCGGLANAGYGNFTFARGTIPTRTDSGGSGLLIPSTPPLLNIFASANSYVNVWDNGTGQNASPSGGQISGCSALSISSADGIWGKCQLLTMATNGYFKAATRTLSTAKYIVGSFGIKNINSTASARLLLRGVVADGITTAPFDLPADADWHYYTFISQPNKNGSEALGLVNIGPSIALGLIAMQSVTLDTLAQAMQFAESGIYINPATL